MRFIYAFIILGQVSLQDVVSAEELWVPSGPCHGDCSREKGEIRLLGRLWKPVRWRPRVPDWWEAFAGEGR